MIKSNLRKRSVLCMVLCASIILCGCSLSENAEEADAANKTGETDTCQHDVAIVYGPSVDYILCVMSEDLTNSDDAVLTIQEISSTVYSYFNL